MPSCQKNKPSESFSLTLVVFSICNSETRSGILYRYTKKRNKDNCSKNINFSILYFPPN